MSKLRKIRKGVDLNEDEARQLMIKSQKAGMKEGQYLRKLITLGCPRQAPGKDFYIAMDNVNRIGTNINQIAHIANQTGTVDEKWLTFLQEFSELLKIQLLEIKEIVLSCDPVFVDFDEFFDYEKKRAIRDGKEVPDVEELIRRYGNL